MAVEKGTAALFARLYKKSRPFEPTAFFDSEMDQLIYLTSPTSYRADRVDAYLTILWDANDLRIVGIKLKGFRRLFDDLKNDGIVEESHFLPLCRVISLLMGRAVASAQSPEEDLTSKQRAKWYKRAEELVGDFRLDERQLMVA